MGAGEAGGLADGFHVRVPVGARTTGTGERGLRVPLCLPQESGGINETLGSELGADLSCMDVWTKPGSAAVTGAGWV